MHFVPAPLLFSRWKRDINLSPLPGDNNVLAFSLI
jgi:hypothetical protein